MTDSKSFYLGYTVPNGGGALLPIKFNGDQSYDQIKSEGDFQEVTDAQVDAFRDAAPVVGAALRNERLVKFDNLSPELQEAVNTFIDANGTGF
jgi:hypothetical protein